MLQHLQLRTLFFVVLVVTALGVGHAAAQDIPLKGAFAGIDGDFNGVAFPIGGFSGVFDAATGTAEWTAFHGTLSNQTTSFVLVQEIWPNVFYYEQTVLFTGGTGRYDGVSGSAEFTGFINLETGAYVGWINGVLSFD
jgi:hypothetical protein